MIGRVHMPLFFFISGWFAYRQNSDGSIVNVPLWQKFRQLMIPMLIVSYLFMLYFKSNSAFVILGDEISFSALWHSDGKFGYWFPVTLFELFIIYSLVVHILNCLNNRMLWIISLASFWICLLGVMFISHTDISKVLQLPALAAYFPCFIAGATCHRSENTFYRLCSDSRWMTFIMILIPFPFYSLCWPDDIGDHMRLFNTLATPVVHICLAFIVFSVFKSWTDRSGESGKASRALRLWSYLGRNSFGIYLMHYFFIFPLTALPSWLQASFLPALIVCLVFAGCIIAATCGLIELIRPSGALFSLVTGSKFNILK